ncbi:MAG: hypothetical protein RLZZ205_557 [Bacteroidota bacterium]|jgi:hypothetical protein
MKKSILFCLMLGLINLGYSQAPQGIPYQAVARDAQGNPMANQSLTVQFSLHEASADGAVVFQETQSTNTNGQGLFSLTFGAGVPSVGTFSSINWGSGYKFLQVQADFGNGYVDLGTQQLMSVPYALYAGSAGNGNANSNSQGNSNYTPSADSVLTLFSAGTILPGSYTIPTNEYWKIVSFFTVPGYGSKLLTANFQDCGFNSNPGFFCRYTSQQYMIFALDGIEYNSTITNSYGIGGITGPSSSGNVCDCPSSTTYQAFFSFNFPIPTPFWLSPGQNFTLNDSNARLMVEKYK